MSVNISKRTENPLEVHVRAVELAAYTYKICDNEKVFKPIHKGLVIKIEEIVTDIYCKAWYANNIRVKDAEGWAERANLQKDAERLCTELLCVINIAARVFHLTAKRVKYWGGITLEVQNLLKAWHESDCRRYDKYKE